MGRFKFILITFSCFLLILTFSFNIVIANPPKTPKELMEKSLAIINESKDAFDKATKEINKLKDNVEDLQLKNEKLENEIKELKENLPKEYSDLLEKKSLKIGSIIPIIGKSKNLFSTNDEKIDDAISNGSKVWLKNNTDWILCNGAQLSDNEYNKIFLIDSDENINGFQVPNLRGRFLFGTEGEIQLPHIGGNNKIEEDGYHYHKVEVFGVDGNMQKKKVDENRKTVYPSGGKGNYGASVGAGGGMVGLASYSGAHNHRGDNRPSFYAVYFVIRVK